jgi:hypothetical protein
LWVCAGVFGKAIEGEIVPRMALDGAWTAAGSGIREPAGVALEKWLFIKMIEAGKSAHIGRFRLIPDRGLFWSERRLPILWPSC